MAEVNLLVIRKTQELLGKFVKKPALSEKLLKKPPFRFLHDVINVVIKETGYLEGVYTEHELQFENVKDKEAKVEFLQKLIDAVKDSSTDKIKVKPSKIVAGLEPERTNELLQAIGKAIDAQNGINNNNNNNNNNSVVKKNNTEPKKPAVVEAKANTKKLATNSSETNKTNNQSKLVNNKSTVKKSSVTGSTSSTSNSSISKAKGTKPVAKAAEGKEKETSAKASSKVKAATNELESSLQRSGTKTIVREGELKKDPNEKVDSLASGPDNTIAVEENNNEITVFGNLVSQKAEDNNGLFVTNQENLTQVLSNTSTNIKTHDEPVGRIPPPVGDDSDLIDVIDQEAEIRRRERSSRKHHERRKSSGHTSGIDEPEVGDFPTIEEDAQPPKSSRPRKSLKIKTDISTVSFEETVSTNEAPPAAAPMIRPRTSLRPPSVRPASARPGAPRRRDKNVEIFLQPDDAAVQMAGINVKVDTFPEVDLGDDGDDLIVIEDPMIGVEADPKTGELMGNVLEMSIKNSNNTDGMNNELSGDQHGHLVQQILQTQKDLVKPDENDNDLEKDFTTTRQRQSSAKQMDMLRDSIQTLTRSVNPLGKLMDFLQEDIDSMQMELAAWRRTYVTAKADLKRESSLNETAVQPLKQQLAQIEASIRDHIELTNASRLNILQNEEKIFKLLSEI